MKNVLIIVLAVILSFAGNSQVTDARLAGLDSMISSILNEWNVPGASVTVVEKNKVILAKGFGYKDYENKTPVTANTLFAIGSCTKAFTASLIGFAVNDKKIELDMPVNHYLPRLKFFSNDLTATVTVKDMLCHRTGLPRHDFSWYSGAAISRDSLAYLIRYLEPSAPLRQTFQYNNYMYLALGSLIEEINGKSWETLVEEKLFAPLGMSSSTTGPLAGQKDFSYGYTYRNGKMIRLDFLTSANKGIAPAGGISSSANDMANWLLMWTNEGRFQEKEIIPTDFYRQAISSQIVATPNLPSAKNPDFYFFNYGLGWYTANYRGHYGVGHAGNINGFSSFVSFLPTDSIGVFVSVNQNNSSVPRILVNLINDRMIGASFRDWNHLLKMPVGNNNTTLTKQTFTSKPSHLPEAFKGTYKNNGYGTITIKAFNDQLAGTFNRWKLKMEHLHHNYYKFSINDPVFDGSEAVTGEFSINAEGGIGALKIAFEDAVKKIEFTKNVITSALHNDFSIYTGDYDFNGTVVKLYLSETKSLNVLVPGQPVQELIYKEQDIFQIKGVKGVRIKFERDEKGNVPSAEFNQPNGTFTVKRLKKNTTETEADGSKNPEQAVTNDGLERYVGEYLLGSQTIKIVLKKNSLIAILQGQPEFELEPVKNNEFTVKGIKGYRVKFNSDEKGTINGFTFTQATGTVTAVKK